MMRPKPLVKRSAKRAFLSALAKIFGVGLGAGAGSIMYKVIGDKNIALPIVTLLGIISFGLLWYVEYERENT